MLTRQQRIHRLHPPILSVHFLRRLAAVLFFLCLAMSAAFADQRPVRVGVYENEPKVFTVANGRPSGIFIDIIEDIAKTEGWKLIFVSGTWAEGLDRLKKGEIDLMPDVAYTSEREKVFAFHKIPVLSVWSQVYAPQGSNIQSILDLNGKRVAALEHTIQLETFSRLTQGFGLKIILVPVADYKTEFEMIAAGRVDAGVTNRFYGLAHARQFGLEDTPVMFDPAPFFFAAPRQAPRELLDAIDRRLSHLQKDPQSAYYASMKRWTSEEVRFKFPVWLKILSLAAAVIVLLSIGGSIALKRQVNARTADLRRANQEMEQRIIERTEKLEQANQKLLREIEEHARTEKALFISETMYRDLVESANSVILRWTCRGEITFINKFAQQFFGFSAAEIIGQNIIGTIVPQTDTAGRDLSRLVTDIIENSASYEGNVNENIRKNKERVWVAWTNRPLIDERGQTVEVLSIGTDITKLVLAQNELRETMAELDRAKERAESADRLKSAFMATMSHELRTPLNSIIGFSGILLQRLGGPLNEEQDKQLKMVYNSAKHLLDLINDVLDISKIEAGQLNVFLETFSLSDSIAKVVKSAQPLADKKEIELTLAIAPDVGQITSDRRRVEQGKVQVRYGLKGDKVVIAVQDSGIGIKPEDMGLLFNAFQQIESGITRKYDGTGLGLSICKKLAHLLDGEIEVESIWGTGSTFMFILPHEG